MHQLEGILCTLHVKKIIPKEFSTTRPPTRAAEAEAESATKVEAEELREEEEVAETTTGSISEMNSADNILSWIIHEKDNQPPCLIVVVDLLDLIITTYVTESRLNMAHSDPFFYLHLPYV